MLWSQGYSALDPELAAGFCRSRSGVNVQLAWGKNGFITTCLSRA